MINTSCPAVVSRTRRDLGTSDSFFTSIDPSYFERTIQADSGPIHNEQLARCSGGSRQARTHHFLEKSSRFLFY
jgi:hypothetical protein